MVVKNYLEEKKIRIDRILKILKKVWKSNPDYRLCQLLSNLFRTNTDLFYIEDERLEQRLKDEL